MKFCPGGKSPVLTCRDWKILNIEEIPGYKSWKMSQGGCLKQDTTFLHKSCQTQLQTYQWIQWMWHRTPTILWRNLTAFESVNLVSLVYALIPRSLPFYTETLIEITQFMFTRLWKESNGGNPHGRLWSLESPKVKWEPRLQAGEWCLSQSTRVAIIKYHKLNGLLAIEMYLS